MWKPRAGRDSGPSRGFRFPSGGFTAQEGIGAVSSRWCASDRVWRIPQSLQPMVGVQVLRGRSIGMTDARPRGAFAWLAPRRGPVFRARCGAPGCTRPRLDPSAREGSCTGKCGVAWPQDDRRWCGGKLGPRTGLAPFPRAGCGGKGWGWGAAQACTGPRRTPHSRREGPQGGLTGISSTAPVSPVSRWVPTAAMFPWSSMPSAASICQSSNSRIIRSVR